VTPYLIYALEVQCTGLRVEVLLNGASVYGEPLGAARFSQMKLNPWIVEGRNPIEVRLGPPPGGKVDSGAELKMQVLKAEHGKELAPDASLLSFVWSEAEQPLEKEGLTPVFEAPVPIAEGHGRWAWEDATPFADGDRPDVEALVFALHAALAARDEATVVAYLGVKTEEYARALDVPAAELESDLRATLREHFAAPDWHMDPVDPAQLALEPSAGGKLVTVTEAGGRAPLRGEGDGKKYTLDLTVSRLAHGFTIVR
jgi:hypothetical protein